tara:strand:+ start:838 stop:1857 length:1020 start_codon:yes stop_codon:yes gene_type:complete
MKNSTRQVYNGYLSQIAQLNGVDDATAKFNVTPTIQQKLETKMQESSAFLSSINVVIVDEMSGAKLGMGIGGPVSSNTDTSGAGERATSDPTSLTEQLYQCRKNNFDTHIKYSKLDQWAKFKDFQTRMRDVIIKRQALDRITVGFNGTSYAATSDIATYPMLQDVNIGWLQKYRDDAPARVMSEVVPASGTITVKAGGDYENLDALVMDAVSNLVAPWYAEDTDLVAIMGRDLLADKYFPLVNTAQPPTEKMAADIIISQKRVGGLQAVRVPFVPAGTILITKLDNLSIYIQESSRRRHIVENAKRDQIENYESSNDDYVIEDYECGCLIENIDTTPAP